MRPIGSIPTERGQAPDREATGPARGPRRRRRGGSSWLVILAVAGVGVVGSVFYGFVRHASAPADRAAGPLGGPDPAAAAAPANTQAPSQPRTISTAPDKAEIRTPIAVLRAGLAGPVVALGRPEVSRSFQDRQGTRQGLLERELVRQALLIAARDELGLSTRDELLDDAPPGPAEGPPAELAILFRPQDCHALVRRGAGEKVEVRFQHDLGARPDNSRYLADLTALAESLARTDFPALLKRLGVEGRPSSRRDDAPVPPGVAERLDELGLVDHFAAVRALHEAIRDDGESPARLAALARAYAQLGALTDYQLSPAHRVFKARALLYAERLLARGPKSPAAIRARAFVLALVGRHDRALADLDAASRLAQEAKDAAPVPSWLPVIEAYLKSDHKRLENPPRPHAKLAALLRLMLDEYPHRTRVAARAARDLAERAEDCDLAYDAMCRNGQLGELHVATVAGPAAFAKLFPIKLKSLTNLPESVKQPLDQGRDEPAVVEALDRAGRPGEDRGEPSWGVLAHLAREARFRHAENRLDFMANKWNVPAGEAFEAFRPLVAQHHFFPYLRYLAGPRGAGVAPLTAMADRLDMAELEPSELPLIQALRDIEHPAAEDARESAMVQISLVVPDIAERLRVTDAARDQNGRSLLNLSPYSAFAMGVLVGAAWDQARGEVPAWREKVGDAPALLAALGRKYAELRDFGEAENYLRRYIELSPDAWAYRMLADCYKARGESERWQGTLDEYLANTEAAGLEHAKVQVEIANDLMKRKRYDDARKYADAAAETGAAWAMICASECYEGLKDWERAEQWIRRTSERYPGSAVAGYRFCKRTGHGDIRAARAFADAQKPGAADRPDPVALGKDGFTLWAGGSPKPAIDALEQVAWAQPNVTPNAIAVFLLADELGDRARRDRLLDELCTRLEHQAPRMATIGRMLREGLVGGQGGLNLAAVDKVLGEMPARTRGNADFLVGRFLLNRGQAEAARKYLRRATDSSQTHPGLREVAAASIRPPEAKKER